MCRQNSPGQPMTEKDLNRAKLHKAASIRFALNADRRAARRKRWASGVLLAEFMTGSFYRVIGERHGMTSRTVREIIRSVITPEQVLNRERLMKAARARKYARQKNPNLIPRPAKIPLAGHPSISAAARSAGITPRAMWMCLHYQKNKMAATSVA